LRLVTLSLALMLIAGCATVPGVPPPAASEEARGQEIAAIARHLIGTPYQFGGADSQGFDCSGLAVFAYERVGLEIPRTAADQWRAAKRVDPASEASPGRGRGYLDLAPGDLVFFRMGSRHINHVGIYTGEGGFVHAPRRGGVVSSASLEDPYFRKRFAGAGRFE
jgi:cell wall-associated NlpC family hydrolase